MLKLLLRSVVLVAVVTTGCGPVNGSADAGPDDAGSSSEDAGVVTDAGSMTDAGQVGDAGTDAGALLVGPLGVAASFESTTLRRTGNSLLVHLQDSTGTPVTGAEVTVSLWMPAHGHGAPAPAVTALTNGDYRAAAVNFTMAGTWEVTVSAVKNPLSASQKLTVTSP